DRTAGAAGRRRDVGSAQHEWAITGGGSDRIRRAGRRPLPGGEPAERIRARTLREARITASLNEVDGVVRIANYFDDEHNVWLERPGRHDDRRDPRHSALRGAGGGA